MAIPYEQCDFAVHQPLPQYAISRVFRASYAGRCASCNEIIYANQNAQFINGAFGHPITHIVRTASTERYARSCSHCPEPYHQTVTLEVPSVSVTDEIRRAEQQLAVLYARQEKMEKFGKDEDYSIGVVISWKPEGSGYWGAAIKIGPNCWKCTAMGYTVTFGRLVEDYLVPAKEVWWNSEMERLDG